MRLPSPTLVGLGEIARGFGKTVIPLHLGPWTPLEVAQAYQSTTALGVQITALQGLYTTIQGLSGGSTSQNYAVLAAETTLGNILIALVALDKQLIAYEAQVQAALAAAGASTSKDTSSGPAACPPGVSPGATVGIGAASAVAGGILGWLGREIFGGKRK